MPIEHPMTKLKSRDAIYLKRQFDSEIIVLCVGWYWYSRLSSPERRLTARRNVPTLTRREADGPQKGVVWTTKDCAAIRGLVRTGATGTYDRNKTGCS